MTFEDLEQQFREARPSRSDLEPTKKSFEMWDAVIEATTKPDGFSQRQRRLSFIASVAIVLGISAILLAPQEEITMTTTPTIATTTSTVEVPLTPNSGFSYGSEQRALERELQRLNSLESCLDTFAFKTELLKFLAETKILGWKITTDSDERNTRCAFGELSSVAQQIKVLYK